MVVVTRRRDLLGSLAKQIDARASLSHDADRFVTCPLLDVPLPPLSGDEHAASHGSNTTRARTCVRRDRCSGVVLRDGAPKLEAPFERGVGIVAYRVGLCRLGASGDAALTSCGRDTRP